MFSIVDAILGMLQDGISKLKAILHCVSKICIWKSKQKTVVLDDNDSCKIRDD